MGDRVKALGGGAHYIKGDVGWWFIPAVWIIIWPLVWIFDDVRGATSYCKELVFDIWMGFK